MKLKAVPAALALCKRSVVLVWAVLLCQSVMLPWPAVFAMLQILLIGEAFMMAHGKVFPALLPNITLPTWALLQTENWEKSVLDCPTNTAKGLCKLADGDLTCTVRPISVAVAEESLNVHAPVTGEAP